MNGGSVDWQVLGTGASQSIFYNNPPQHFKLHRINVVI